MSQKKGLLILLVLLAVNSAWAGAGEDPREAEREAVGVLSKLGSRADIDGDQRVVSFTLGADVTDDDLKLLSKCERLSQLVINCPKVTDAGIKHLRVLAKLTSLNINQSRISPRGQSLLSAALPNCRVTMTGRDGRTGPQPRPRQTSFGSPNSPTIRLLQNEAVRAELGISRGQQDKLQAALEPAALTALVQAIDAKIVALLTAEQRARLEQLQLQQVGSAVALLRADVLAELKLTAEQKASAERIIAEVKSGREAANFELSRAQDIGVDRDAINAKFEQRMLELAAQRRKAIWAMLNKEQQATMTRLLGAPGPNIVLSPFAERLALGEAADAFRFGSAFSLIISVVRNPDVQADLKLNAEQQTAINDAISSATVMKSIDANVVAILTPQQQARLQQIEWQQAGIAALVRDEVAQKLKFTERQREQLVKLRDESVERFKSGSDEISSTTGGVGAGKSIAIYKAIANLKDELKKEFDEKVRSVLSDEQHQAWQAMLGPAAPKLLSPLDRLTPQEPAGRQTVPAQNGPAPPTAAKLFDQYDLDRDGSLSQTECPSGLTSALKRAGSELMFPVSRAEFEKVYGKYLQTRTRP